MDRILLEGDRVWFTSEADGFAHVYSATASGADKRQIVLGKELMRDEQGRPLEFRGSPTDSIAFSADGTLAFLAGRGGRIYVFDTETQEIVHTIVVDGWTKQNFNSLVVNDGWLYVAEGDTGPSGIGRLMRICVDQTSEEYLRTQQQLVLTSVDAPLGFGDMAVSFGWYLAVTALRQADWVGNFPKPVPGNIYVIDLYTLSSTARVQNSVVLDASNFPLDAIFFKLMLGMKPLSCR